jgi:plasmid maintenance system antidote protein VapI
MKMIPPHPGETIEEDYLIPIGMSVNELAKRRAWAPVG